MSECEKHRERREREKGQGKTREGGEEASGIRRQSPGRGFGPSHETATSSLSFIRINLLNVSPTIMHTIKLAAL